MDLRCSENRTTSDYHHYSIHSIIFCCTECKTKLRSVLPGALFTSIIWLVGSFLFGWYISNFGNYNKTYGSLAGIIILFLWLYITSFIIIIGAEINAIIHQRKVIKGHTPEEAALLHDDNNQNHYNEDTTYEYNNDTPQNKDENYNIDQNADNEKPEDQETLKDKIVDKFKTTMTTMKKSKINHKKAKDTFHRDFRLYFVILLYKIVLESIDNSLCSILYF